MEQVYFNPNAGSGRAAKMMDEWRKANGKTDSDYIVIGGDGTFNALLNELSKPELYSYTIIPAGTSNSLSRSMVNDGFTMVDLWEITLDGKTYRFINEASVGFAGAIAREIEQRKTKRLFNRLKLNELAYIATAFRCWFTDKPYFLSLCNNRRISGDLYPCVDAKIDDKWLDTYELDCPRWRLPIELLKLVKAKKDKSSRFVLRRRVQDAEWYFETPLPVEIDGNPLPPVRQIKISRYPKQIAVSVLRTIPKEGTSSRKTDI